jgi:hypothetical protein
MRCRFAGKKCASAICSTIITITRSPLLPLERNRTEKKREKTRQKGRGREGGR